MSTSTATLTPSNSSDAAFRAWGSAIGTALTAAGWVQTSDTGQINWTTVLAPVATQTVQGYELWRMNDTLQATTPIFLKLEFGSGTVATNPSIWFQLASGSLGDGRLGGQPTTRFQLTATASTASTSYFSGDTNRWSMALHTSSSALTHCLVIERTHDASGVDTAEGACLMARGLNGTVYQQYWHGLLGSAPAESSTLGALTPSTGTTGLSGTQLALYPLMFVKLGGAFHSVPMRDVIMYFANDIAGAAVQPVVTFSHLGSPRTYLALGSVGAMLARPGSVALAIRYQ
jgi:hypothetical protein